MSYSEVTGRPSLPAIGYVDDANRPAYVAADRSFAQIMAPRSVAGPPAPAVPTGPLTIPGVCADPQWPKQQEKIYKRPT